MVRAASILIGLFASQSAADAGIQGAAPAQSIAASLSGYAAVLRISSVAGVTAKSFSGVAFHPGTRTLHVIDNDNAVIYELNASGVLLRSIATSGFQDPEGIAYQSDDHFLISEEGLGNIVRIKVPRTGSGPLPWPAGAALSIAQNLANSGIEGISYRSADKTAFAVKETDPPRLYRIALNAAGVPAASFPDEPFDIGNKSGDAADIHALNDGNFIVVNQEQNKLEGYGPMGEPLSSLSLGMAKPEGLAIDTADGTLYVVGEPAEFAVFRKPGTRSRDAGAGRNAIAFSLLPGGTRGAAPTLRIHLPAASRIRIETASLKGAWVDAFSGTMAMGTHSIGLTRSGLSAGASGIGFCRITAGSERRVFQYAIISADG